MKDLHGRTALVTGASGGLGTHIATRLAREGVDVAVSGRREPELQRVAEELRRLGVRAAAVAADLADLGNIDPLVDGVEAELGPIDLLVNNAGVENTAAFTSYSREELTSMVDVNLTAPLLLTHRLTPGMLRAWARARRLHSLGRRQGRARLQRALCGHQGRAGRADSVAARRVPGRARRLLGHLPWVHRR